ncbi:MAG: aldo/keto reductase [Halieaceae bacterium]|jgi:diketogulonate reductase-like aldo/keto reductase|nr:aldo/keto reductase [Halieaceae bacterium]
MITRRNLLAAAAALPFMRIDVTAGAEAAPITRPIPSSGEALPVIGMGSSRTFDVSPDDAMMGQLTEVVRLFFAGGGAMIDSSPMYGQAESTLGAVLQQLGMPESLFAATKVWTYGADAGIEQMRESSRRMNVPAFDLMQIHNLRDWKLHLPTLRRWKEEGKIRYLGITTSHQRNHAELEEIMRTEPLDFVQFSYNIENRLAEERLLPISADRGIATIINRPFQRGALFSRSSGQPLPPLAKELGCESWGQFYLKWIIGHPAVTCLIPATSKPKHMRDNMGANFGPVPDAAQRAEMLKIFESL